MEGNFQPKILTRESASLARACYTDEKIASLVPEAGLCLREVANLNILENDRVWAIICAMGFPYEILEPWIVTEVEKAIRAVMPEETNPEWQAWAERWLSGEDRTAKSAFKVTLRLSGVLLTSSMVSGSAMALDHARSLRTEKWERSTGYPEKTLARAANSVNGAILSEKVGDQLSRLVDFLESQSTIDSRLKDS